MRCDWAGCSRRGQVCSGGWRFCNLHLDEHLRQTAEEVVRVGREGEMAGRIGGLLLPSRSLAPLLAVLESTEEVA